MHPLLRNRYRVIEPLGRGGFGKTYLAMDTDKLNALCVVKQLAYVGQTTPTIHQKIEQLFEQEAKQLYLLESNPQIPTLLASFKDNTYLYLVQQYVEGQTLLEEFTQQGPFSETKIQAVLEGLLPVLHFIHHQGVIHRDLKPENIMRRRVDGQLVLIDFGVSKQISLTSATLLGTELLGGTQVGSLGYAPIEQLNQSKIHPASDLYSLGVTCFYLLSGTAPDQLQLRYGYSWLSDWQKHLPTQITSPKVAKVLNKLLRENIKERYRSAIDVLQDLNPSVHRLHKQSSIPSLRPLTPSPGDGVSTVPSPPTQPVNEGSQGSSQTSRVQTLNFEVITVNAQGRETSRIRDAAEYFTQDLGKNITLELMSIPGGHFQMGSPDTEIGRSSSEGPQQSITLTSFFMGKYPVTQAQWYVVASLSKVDRELELNPSHFKGGRRPVERVSWDDAVEFCARLSQNTSRAYRLPTEAEWEYACRGGTTTPFYFGDTITPDLANYNGAYAYRSGPKGNYCEQTTPVGKYPPNAFGVHDMHGNVWEWCMDHWHDTHQDALSDGSAWVLKGNEGSRRVIRGGSWVSYPLLCRSAHRDGEFPSFRGTYIGFRVVCSAP